jgi:outer membrane protein TolC
VQSSKAEENLRVQQNRYREGIGSFLEVRLAATALKESRLRELDADYDYMLAQLSLLVATGQVGSERDPFLGSGPDEVVGRGAPESVNEAIPTEEDHAH